ncbi:MAG: DNA-protecting protein DprA [Actinomycetia bacterium]|nr:DNA-protecting protein DprA [Actinomycetes bacterium]
MTWDEERLARAVLTCVVDPGDDRLAGLLAREGAAAVLAGLRASHRDDVWPRRARELDPACLVERTRAHGLRFIVPGDAEWPTRLDDLARCGQLNGMGGVPFGLWATGPGDVAAMSAQAVAIVGSRASSSYGERVGADLGVALAGGASGRPVWTVVSGGAYGIDAAAHRGALAARGPTIGVYAGGLDVAYPLGNADLFERLRGECVVVSEVPPGHSPSRRGFLARNRLIAALATGVVVVEAAARSGAKNSAAWADLLHRVVMAVPGPVYSVTSVGTHQLIRDGRASLVTGPDDVWALLAPLGVADVDVTRGQARLFDRLSHDQQAVFEAFPARGTTTVGELSVRSGVPMAGCHAALTALVSLGLIAASGDGTWRLARRAAPGRPVGPG